MRKVVALVHSFDCSELLIVPTSNNQVHVYSQQNILSKIDQQSIETSLLPRIKEAFCPCFRAFLCGRNECNIILLLFDNPKTCFYFSTLIVSWL